MVAGLAALVVGFFFPGFGAAVAGRLRWALGWAIAVVVLFLCTLATPWAIWLSLAARITGAFQGGWFVYRAPKTEWFSQYTLATAGAHVIASILIFAYALEGFAAPSSSMSPTLMVGDHVFADKLTPRFKPIERGDVILFRYPCDQRRDWIKRVVAVGGDTVEIRCHVVYLNGKAVPTTQVAAHTRYVDHDETSDDWPERDVSEYRETLGGHTYDVYSAVDRAEARDEPASRDFPQRGRSIVPSCSDAPDYDGQVSAARKLSGTGKIVEDKPDGTPACEPQLHFVVPPRAFFVMGDNRDNSNDSRVWGVVGEDAVIGRANGIWLSKTTGYSWARVRRFD